MSNISWTLRLAIFLNLSSLISFLSTCGFVFGYDIDGIFVSDGSSLHDFLGVMDDVKTIEAVVKKINKRYGVDVKEVQDEPIVDVIAFMLKKDSSCFK